MLVECKLTGLMYDPDVEFKKILEKPVVQHVFKRLKGFDYDVLRSKTRDEMIAELAEFHAPDELAEMEAIDLIDAYLQQVYVSYQGQ